MQHKTCMMHYRCLGEPEKLIDEELCHEAGVRIEDVFCRARAMAAVAQHIRHGDGDAICKLPFAATAEAEQLGVKEISFSRYHQPVVSAYTANNLQQLEEIKEFSFDEGIMGELMLAISSLSEKGELVSMNIEGPFTLLGMLVPSKEIYKGMRREPDRLKELCRMLIRNIAKEAAVAAAAGATILSYADPLISCNMISPALFKNMCGEITCEALQAITMAAPQTTIHVCSATSTAFEQAGFCRCYSHNVPENICYGEALCLASHSKNGLLVGHGCIQHSDWLMEKPVIYELELCE